MTVSTPAVAPSAPVPTRPRLLYIDNLRILLTAMVVLHHIAVTYGNIPVWYYSEPGSDPSSIMLDVLAGIDQTQGVLTGSSAKAAVGRGQAAAFHSDSNIA